MDASAKFGADVEWQPMQLHQGLFHKTVLSRDEAKDLNLHLWRILHERIDVGGQIFPHMHDVTEVIHITKGSVRFLLDKEAVAGGPGDTFVVPAGTRHAVANTGSAPSEQISFFIPDRNTEEFGNTQLLSEDGEWLAAS